MGSEAVTGLPQVYLYVRARKSLSSTRVGTVTRRNRVTTSRGAAL